MKVERISAENWRILSEHAHMVCFNEKKPASRDRIDYALLVKDEQFMPLAYVTVREVDSDTVYWQFGGAFPSAKGTPKSFHAYCEMLSWTGARYKRITTLIENTNTAMLRFAMKVGYRIIGVRNFNGSVLLEHLLEF